MSAAYCGPACSSGACSSPARSPQPAATPLLLPTPPLPALPPHPAGDKRLDEWVPAERVASIAKVASAEALHRAASGGAACGSTDLGPLAGVDQKMTRRLKRQYTEIHHVPAALEELPPIDQVRSNSSSSSTPPALPACLRWRGLRRLCWLLNCCAGLWVPLQGACCLLPICMQQSDLHVLQHLERKARGNHNVSSPSTQHTYLAPTCCSTLRRSTRRRPR